MKSQLTLNNLAMFLPFTSICLCMCPCIWATDTHLLSFEDIKESIIPPCFMSMSQLALITLCNQGPFQGHGPLSELLSGLDRRIEGGGCWRGRSAHPFTLHQCLLWILGCQRICQTMAMWLPALRWDLQDRGVCWSLEKASVWNGKSMFHQIESDGQSVTLRPSHLTSTNGCTRLPVQANTLPSKSPPQIDSTSSAIEKYLRPASFQPQTWWPLSSIRNTIFPPVGFKLSLGMPNIALLWYLWAACGWCETLFII